MKQFLIFTAFVLITSCGSSKKVIEEKEVESEVESESRKLSGEIEKDIDFMIKEDIAIEKDLNPRDIFTDTISIIKIEKKADLPLPPKPPKLEDKSKNNFDVRFNTILKKYVSEKGNVNYAEIRKNRTDLDVYIDYITENLPKDNWSENEKLAYWINAYNALTIDLILRNYPLNSIKHIKDPWDQRLWKFGDKWLNLNHIEHEILRKMDEPRIHFAIVCASFSCPKLQNEAFTASKLDEQLTKATKEFLKDSQRNKISENRIELSKIFRWFSKDFETNGSLIDFLNKYSDVEISSKVKKSFLDYNWDLND